MEDHGEQAACSSPTTMLLASIVEFPREQVYWSDQQLTTVVTRSGLGVVTLMQHQQPILPRPDGGGAGSAGLDGHHVHTGYRGSQSRHSDNGKLITPLNDSGVAEVIEFDSLDARTDNMLGIGSRSDISGFQGG
jgi:hypothetical protein